MWIYEKKLQYPVRVSGPNPRLAKIVLEQYGGSDGEAAAANRYLTQRYTMPTGMAKGVLTDIGTEELAHWELIATLYYKLMKGVTPAQAKAAGLDAYYANHGKDVFLQNAGGVPFTAAYFATKGDPVANLVEDMAAEQKARATYENILDLSDDPCVNDTLKFLREREVVHFQRFGEVLDNVQTYMNSKKVF
ncbi:manganese catalase family protein [Phosphitispora sp. TUW77]|uniref:manganese catalase family protein n=1 Tax=Phosphitispora sp. TUW77 TaxID=3152361 RepID=UPI003AB47532